MLKIIATLCRLSDLNVCHDVVVATSDFQDLTMSACMVGVPALAEWMKQHPAERLASWKCQIGTRDRRGI